MGIEPGSPLANNSWSIRRQRSGQQLNSYNCGLWVLINAEASILGTNLLENVDDFRRAIATQFLQIAKLEPMKFPVFPSQLSGAYISENLDLSRFEDVVDIFETNAKDKVIVEGDFLSDIDFYSSAEDKRAILVHKAKWHKVPEYTCFWLGCYESLPDADSLEIYIQRWHENREYIAK